MMLPPKSGRKAVRLRNASIIMSLSTLYSEIVAAWISSESRPREKPGAVTSLKEWIPGVREKIIAVAGQLQAVKTQTAIAKWEGSIRGHWPSDEYLRLADIEIDMMSNLALVRFLVLGARCFPEKSIEFMKLTTCRCPSSAGLLRK